MKRLSKQVDDWNKSFKVGQPVSVRLDDGTIKRTRTRSDAQILSGHTAVVWLNGISGCYSLDRVSIRQLDPGETALRAAQGD